MKSFRKLIFNLEAPKKYKWFYFVYSVLTIISFCYKSIPSAVNTLSTFLLVHVLLSLIIEYRKTSVENFTLKRENMVMKGYIDTLEKLYKKKS